MNYYHTQDKKQFEAFYRDKRAELLLNPSVKELIDNNSIDLNQLINRLNYSEKKPKSKDYHLKLVIKHDLSEVEEAIERSHEEMITSLKAQMELFEERKKEKLKRKGAYKGIMMHNAMFIEIEEMVDKNMNELFKALDELSLAYNNEILKTIESGFADIAIALREDLDVEIENLTFLYEEQRLNQTESIRHKYKQRPKGRQSTFIKTPFSKPFI